MAVIDGLSAHQISEDLGERLIRTRRRLEYAKAWLGEIETELVKIGATIDGLKSIDSC